MDIDEETVLQGRRIGLLALTNTNSLAYHRSMSMQPRSPSPTADSAERATEAGLFKALADPHRLTILATLIKAQDEVCVCDLTELLPLNQPTVSHHLRLLREASLVTCERRGTWVYYRIAVDARDRLDAAVYSVFPERTLA